MHPLIKAVFDELPTEPKHPLAPLLSVRHLPVGAKPEFPNREKWLKLLNAALDMVYERHVPDISE